uniref:Reverse transcriptase domain-containing protein n=1 Tax=Cacopsylla melanoneura TaxID=428564 RepID=A0A8D8WJ63_9HEMI
MSASQSDDVFCPHCRGKYKRRGLNNHIRAAHRNVQISNNGISLRNTSEVENVEQLDPFEAMIQKAYGAPLINSYGDESDSVWHVRWKIALQLRGKHYNSEYQLPQGAVGRQFVSTLAEEIQSIADKKHVSDRTMFFCAVLLQREKSVTKGSDIRRLLKKRLDLWREEKFDELLHEAQRCDRQLGKNRNDSVDEEHRIRIFTRLVLQGKLRDANRWITNRDQCGVLNLDKKLSSGKTVLEVLQEKHPDSTTPALIDCDELPCLLDVDITANHIEKVARSIRGSAGPSGTNAESWSCFLLKYGNHSTSLRESVASLIRFIANGIVDWHRIRAILARRGVALDKCPGVRPIGIGEVLQRICAKTMAIVTGEDVQETCGARQLCSGIKSGLEGAIHGFSSVFDDSETEGILLVDARNAFNVLNRQAALWNVRVLWPRCSRFLFNTYRGFSIIMFRNSAETLLSKEGTTQGDPLAMLFYGVGIMPLIDKLMSTEWVQNWYADDSACIGKLRMIRKWFDLLRSKGPNFGYYPEPNKSYLVVKPEYQEEAETVFEGLNVNVVTGTRFLGGVIGNEDQRKDYVKEKVTMWISCVNQLSIAAEKSPQAAFSVMTKSLQSEWSFIQRVVENCQEEYIPLREIIQSTLVPAIFQHEISPNEHELFHLPTRYGGLGIHDPVETATHAFEVTTEKCRVLVNSLIKQEPLNLQDHNQCVKNAINTELARKDNEQKEKHENILSTLPSDKQRVLTRIVETKSSQWLNQRRPKMLTCHRPNSGTH